MKVIKHIKDLNLRVSISTAQILTTVGLGALFSDCFAESGGKDYLATLKPDIQATFGTGSVAEYVLLGAEAISIVAMFTKTKNYMVFGALPILMTFTHWALK